MISKDKKYKTRIGLPVRIYEILEKQVTGIILDREEKHAVSASIWSLKGHIWDNSENGNDLIEISPYANLKIDDKVLVWDNEYPNNKYKRYFAGISSSGKPSAWIEGATSFSVYDNTSKSYISTWDHCEKYEENND